MGDTLADGAGAGAPEPDEPVVTDRRRARRRPLAAGRGALRTLISRPPVRAAIRLVRRGAPLGAAMGRGWARLRAIGARVGLVAAAGPSWPARRRRRAALDRALVGRDAASGSRLVSVIGPRGDGGGAVARAGVPVEHVVIEGPATPAAAGRAVPTATGEVLCFLLRPVDEGAPGWLARLVDALGEGVVAATPTVVHPARPWWRATEHDLLAGGQGVEIGLDPEGAPVVASRGVGQPPAVDDDPAEVVGAPLQCLVVDRAAFLAAGGLDPHAPDADAAGIDLCARLAQHGGRVVHVPAAVVVADRPVASRGALQELVAPGGRAHRWLVDQQGAWLAGAARGDDVRPTRWAITTAAPSAKVAPRWGDFHLAEALARSLRRQGQDVVVQAHDGADAPSARARDLHLVLRGLAPVRATPGQRQILWVISHPEAVTAEECDAADLVLVASHRFAAALAERTATPVEVLLQATDTDRFRPLPVDAAHRHDVTVVAKTRDVRRRAVVDALEAGLRPAIYGGGWRDLVDPSLVVADHVDNELLPVVYSSAGVVLNDHWDTMREWGFVSNRIYDVLACGTPVISDDVADLHELFGEAVPTYRTSAELGVLVQRVLAEPEAARAAAARGRAVVGAEHTFDRRAEQLLALVARYRLVPRSV